MAIARCVETRLLEAVYLKLSADNDLKTKCASGDVTAPRIYLGPVALDPVDIAPPQINIMYVPNEASDIGVGGVTGVDMAVSITYFQGAVNLKFTLTQGAAGGSNGLDVLIHCQKLIIAGNGTNMGRLSDPDSTATPQATINTDLVGFNITTPTLTAQNAALMWSMIARFKVNIDKTRARA